jgi:hypothetical protein
MRKTRTAALVVCTAVLLVVLVVPTALAAPSSESTTTPASGTWTWVVNEKSMTVTQLPNGNQYLTGYEIGTWKGTFAGSAREPFEAMFIGTNGLWATLTINFKGKVNGVSGKMTMLVIAYAPDYPAASPVAMNGSWWIQKGYGRLSHLHGAGTWTTYLDDRAPTYAGDIWHK